MHQRKWLRAVALISCCTWALVAQEAAPAPAPAPVEAKPGQTVQVPAHRSKWDFPKEITILEGTQLHVVQKGDTLWDLGNKYLGNPFSWPQIWELNKWITDPHWIYPEDYLLVPGNRQAVTGETPAEIAQLQPDRRRFISKPAQDEYAFTFQDFIQLPYIAPKGAEAHYKELGAIQIVDRQAKERTELGEGENLYLDGGSGRGLKIGDRMIILRTLKSDLYAPGDTHQKHWLGDVIKQVGVVRLTQVENKVSVGVIEKAMDGIHVGDHLATFTEPANLVAKLRTDITEPVPVKAPAASVIYIPEGHSINGPGEMLIIDQGSKNDLKVGDLLIAIQQHDWVVDTKGSHVDGRTNSYLAQLVVVKVGENSATCRVLRAQKEIMPGDIVTR